MEIRHFQPDPSSFQDTRHRHGTSESMFRGNRFGLHRHKYPRQTAPSEPRCGSFPAVPESPRHWLPKNFQRDLFSWHLTSAQSLHRTRFPAKWHAVQWPTRRHPASFCKSDKSVRSISKPDCCPRWPRSKCRSGAPASISCFPKTARPSNSSDCPRAHKSGIHTRHS